MWAPNNPFLWDIAVLEHEEQQAAAAAAGQHGQQLLQEQRIAEPQQLQMEPGRQQHTKLPEFWPHAPGMWFARTECHFELMGVHSERQKFCCVADSLPYETMRLVVDLIAAQPAVEPYEMLKERLMLAHALTPTQRAEKLFALLSDLLVEMYEYCPPGEEMSTLFKAHFLTRLPPEIRVHLEAVEDSLLKQLALWADQLWLTLVARQQAVVAVVQEQEQGDETDGMLAALRTKFFQKNKGRKGASGGDGQAAAAADGGKEACKKLVNLNLCWWHAKFGSKAFRCADKASCQWQEN
jgi:hypothetical protein